MARSLAAVFAEQVRLQHSTEAFTDNGSTWTYAELDRLARSVGAGLVDRIGGPPARVVTVLTDGVDLVSVILGAALVGHVVVVADPAEPSARLRVILEDVDPAIVVVDPTTQATVAAIAPSTVIVVDRGALASGRTTSASTEIDADHLAAIIYTSGSSGGPKGVIQTHGSLLHKVERLRAELGVGPGDRIPLLSPLSGSSGITLLWLALSSGATLDCFGVARRGVADLGPWLQRQRSTVLITSASLFRHLLRTLEADVLADLRAVVLGGETVLAADAIATRAHVRSTCRFGCLLASTEAGSVALHWVEDVSPVAGALPCGRPVAGIEVDVVAADGASVAIGEVGEIVVTSPHLSPGYWNDPERTADRFDGDPPMRRFRTGDLASSAADGTLILAGRLDLQAKVRGNRVDLAEIESALVRLPGVTAAAAGLSVNDRGDARLVAWVTADDGAPWTVDDLRAGLRHELPSAHVPTHLEIIEELPVNRQGKVDRVALGARTVPRPGSVPPVPVGALAAELAGLWAEALDLDSVPLDRGFFDLGGDSLAAAVVAAQVESRLGVRIDLCDFASSPSVETMAARIDRHGSDRPPAHLPLVQADPSEAVPLSSAQERVWATCRSSTSSLGQTIALSLDLIGPLDIEALCEALEDLVDRHESLRTTVQSRQGGPIQVVHPPGWIAVDRFDVSAERDPAASAAAMLDRSAHRPFDPEVGPLLRLDVVRLGEHHHRLHRVVHHLVSDAWSYRLFLDELMVCYSARADAEAPALPPLRFQYRDYARWERQELRSGRIEEQTAWWADRLATRTGRESPFPCRRTNEPTEAEDADGLLWWGLDADTASGLDRIARHTNFTPHVVRLAVFALQLAVDTGRRDLVIGMSVLNRRLPELQTMVGDFTNLVTLLLEVDAGATIEAWIGHVAEVVAVSSANSEVPYERVGRHLSDQGIELPAIRAVFGSVDEPPPVRMGDVRVLSMVNVLQLQPQCLTFLVNSHHEHDRCQVSFDPTTYDRTEVLGFIHGYQRLAAALVESSADLTLAELTVADLVPELIVCR